MKHILSILALAACLPAFAHGKLTASSPAAGASLDKTPAELRLTFSEKLEAPFSKVALTDAANAAVSLPKATVDEADPKTMAVALPPLKRGSYNVAWTIVTRDGHKMKGTYGFTVK